MRHGKKPQATPAAKVGEATVGKYTIRNDRKDRGWIGINSTTRKSNVPEYLLEKAIDDAEEMWRHSWGE